LIIISSRYNTLKDQISRGIIPLDDQNTERNRITNSLLNIIDQSYRLQDKKTLTEKERCALAFYTGWILLELRHQDYFVKSQVDWHLSIVKSYLKDIKFELSTEFIEEILNGGHNYDQFNNIIKELGQHFGAFMSPKEQRHIECGFNLLISVSSGYPQYEHSKTREMLSLIDYPEGIIPHGIEKLSLRHARNFYDYFFNIVKTTKYFFETK
jgi:hypothetical protein